MEPPSNPDARAVTWSNQESTNTLKLLASVTPNAFYPVFVRWQDLDKQLTIRSGLLDLKPGDTARADRGFEVENILLGVPV